MNTKMSRRQKDIKSKLMAAIAMLLVSSIMMVSTTYAWFTLSTAPEVTGISTQVGANGNLEMALLPADITLTALDDPENGIKSGDGDSYANTKDHTESNITWGNLVDVSDASYGLSQIKLYPSALNLGEKDDSGKYQNEDANGNPTVIDAAMVLKTPTYGADGRVMELVANALTGIYNTEKSSFFPDNGTTKYGVRAVGVASGMSPRQLAYRNAQSSAASYVSSAKNQAVTSLETNGAALADIAIKHGLNAAATFTQTELGRLLAIVNDLNKAGGILDTIEKAYKQYILAYASSKTSNMQDADWQLLSAAVEGSTLDALITTIETYVGTENTQITAIKVQATELKATKTKVNDAATKLNALVGENNAIAWGDLSTAMGDLVSTENLKVNTLTVSEIKADPNLLVNKYMNDKDLIVSIADNGGVYADVAKHCGNFSSGITIKQVQYGQLDLTNVPAKMETTVAEPHYLPALGTAIKTNTTAPDAAAAAENPMTDMYGYIIDMAFRTNATDSNLLLQSDAVDRIYDSNQVGAQIDGDETTTMGGGTYMTLASTTPNFNNDNVKELMKGVRIVFFTPVDGSVVATAKLDTATAEATTEGVKAKIYTYTLDAQGAEVKSTDNKIMGLTQNQAVALSVLVYLDGNYVTNKHVATEATSVTGTMNLQFSSSAELVPMDYTPLKSSGIAAPDANEPAQQNVVEQQNAEGNG